MQENAYCLRDYCEPRFVDTVELPELRDLSLQIAEVSHAAFGKPLEPSEGLAPLGFTIVGMPQGCVMNRLEQSEQNLPCSFSSYCMPMLFHAPRLIKEICVPFIWILNPCC